MNETEAAVERLSRGHYRPEDRHLLPLAVSAAVAAGACGVSVNGWWNLIRVERCPLPVLRIGRSIRHRTSDLLGYLIGESEGAA
ncbi:hypothetical protein [Nakamurella sp. PAMC28650]|uniref:hypothetical protein n=1 Tax=Nakamurella sp. PAMC28650 TaxID=2762325 RepID=UPI00164E78C5|nr:hypothetical protein [Nakamurella sp. PAMC28650]QNK80414.1 hypothetical protein H7F38_19865 [Nakamurella sp. PAMC28650]